MPKKYVYILLDEFYFILFFYLKKEERKISILVVPFTKSYYGTSLGFDLQNLTELKEEVDLLSKERRELKRVLFLILLRVLINVNLQILLPMKWHQNNYFYTGNISFTSQSGETKGY